jgi:hypothetical protein
MVNYNLQLKVVGNNTPFLQKRKQALYLASLIIFYDFACNLFCYILHTTAILLRSKICL